MQFEAFLSNERTENVIATASSQTTLKINEKDRLTLRMRILNYVQYYKVIQKSSDNAEHINYDTINLTKNLKIRGLLTIKV